MSRQLVITIIPYLFTLTAYMASGQVLGKEAPKWYVAIEGVHSNISSADVSHTTYTNECSALGCNTETVETKIDTEFDNSNEYRLNIGYQLSESVRVDLGYHSESVDLKPDSFYAGRSLDVSAIRANLWQRVDYEFAGFSPYFGGSLVLGEMELGDADGKFVAIEVGLGASYQLLERFVVDVGYRYILSEPDIELEGGSFDDQKREVVLDYRGSAVAIGLRYLVF